MYCIGTADEEQCNNNNISYFHFQYLGSFPVQAVDQGDRAEFVRKQLVSMKVILNIKFQACNLFKLINTVFSSIYHYVSFTGGHAETTGADGDIPCWYKSVLPTRPGNALFQIIVYTIVFLYYVSTETYFIVVCYIFIAVKTLIENMLD